MNTSSLNGASSRSRPAFIKKGEGVVAVVPMKPLHLAKSRLSKLLDPGRRAALTIGMFTRVVTAAQDSAIAEISVVGGDDEVRGRARQLGARWIEDVGKGLNEAVTAAMDAAAAAGLPSMYLPADLPFLRSTDIAALLTASENGTKLALAPAQRDGGTNAMLVPSRSAFRPVLGRDSFRLHKDLALRLGMRYAVCESPGFALDLDTPADLKLCMERESGFLESLIGIHGQPSGSVSGTAQQ